MTDYARRQINLLLDMKERTESVQEKAVLARAIGLISMQEPKKDSYTGTCANCGKPIWQSARYCPCCGWRQPDFHPGW
jgi:rubrerythrin